MIRWLKPPKSIDAAKYIECYWYLEKTSDSTGNERPKLNPDPSANLILSLPKQYYHYETSEGIRSGHGCHWLYPYCNTYELDHTDPVVCIGIKFKVGALYSLKKTNFSQALLNTVQALSFAEIVTASLICEKDILASARAAPEECAELLDELLQPLLDSGAEDKHSEMTRKIMPLLANNAINAIGNILHCSQRTVERSFLKVTGLTLKQYQSITKLESILECLYQRKPSDIDWVDIAYQFGFSDQLHLIRYLKQYIDLTPKNYVSQRGFTIDVYGGVKSK